MVAQLYFKFKSSSFVTPNGRNKFIKNGILGLKVLHAKRIHVRR